MKREKVLAVPFALLMSSPVLAAAERPCDTVVGLLTTDFVYGVSNDRLARVEIRQCLGQSAAIQLVAWKTGDATPALIVNTNDFGVVQTTARGNVFVIETGGATRDQVFVIVFTRGSPEAVLQRVTRGTAQVRVGRAAIDIEIDGVYAGDNPPRTEVQHFAIDPEGTKRI